MCATKRHAEQRHVIERAVTCIFCNRELHEGDWHTIGGYRYCRECSEKIARPAKQEPTYRCTVCGEPMSIHDVRMVRDGKEFCEKCYHEAFGSDGKEKVYRCSQCDRELTRFQVKMRGGVNYCTDCYGEAQNAWESSLKKKLHNMTFAPKDLEKGPAEKPGKKPDEKDFGETAQLFKCLGDPCRVRIIESLADHDMSVFAFVEMTGFQYSAISYHLKMLKDMGLVYSFRSGNFQVYSLTNKGAAVHEFIAKSIELK